VKGRDPDPELVRRVFEACGPEGTSADALVLADAFLERAEARLAARALDRAFGLAPDDAAIARQRGAILDSLGLEEGLRFRFVPGGPFLMGSAEGDPDERPVHAATTGDFWLSDTPVTWASYCRLMGWEPPPGSGLSDEQGSQIRLQYCETETTGAIDWHVHAPESVWESDGKKRSSVEIFGRPPRGDPSRPLAYDSKPMVAVTLEDAQRLCQRLSTDRVEYRLPSEAEWEKAARGGRIGARWPWGNVPPDPSRCDFGHFGEFKIVEPRRLAPNGYGLFGICGGVWEWTRDPYDALAYRGARGSNPGEVAQVLRGGSWSDCAQSCTVSFRMAQPPDALAANIGFRICRVER
jgi:formylglycine-generating enzyme required for sulfatase activity